MPATSRQVIIVEVVSLNCPDDDRTPVVLWASYGYGDTGQIISTIFAADPAVLDREFIYSAINQSINCSGPLTIYTTIHL